jgi:adenosylmethionine-8-amino-7-oxononanoate aminotransferase
MKNTQDLLSLDKNLIWHPFTPLVGSAAPLLVTHAKGAYLYTADNRQILDAIGSWWVNLHGHSHPHLAQAIASQAHTLEHVIFAGFTHEPAITLVQRLLAILPANQTKAFFSDNGSTAVEVALKMAMQFWYNNEGVNTRRRKIVALDGAYHGDTFGAMSVGERSAFSAPFSPFLFEVEFLSVPTAASIFERNDLHSQPCLEQFERLARSGEVAAFIFEPLVQGASGMRMYSLALLNQLMAIAKENNILCIADEVMTGFGRTGKLFASEYLDIAPDMMCLSKGLTGGAMPLGLTTCTDALMQAYQTFDLLKTFFHGHSFTANPLACAVANASLDLLLAEECTQNRERIAAQHQIFAKKIANHRNVKQVRTLGVILVVEFDTQSDTSYFNEARHHLYAYFLDKNILLRPLGNIVYILPPYILSNEELETVYSAISELLDRDFLTNSN